MVDIKGRTLGLFGALDRETCLAACEAILRLASVPSRRPLHLYLGCEGGEADDVLMLLDCLKARRGQLRTYAMSHIRGMGLLLFTEGDQRLALPHAQISTECLNQQQGLGFNVTTPRPYAGGGFKVQKYLEERLGHKATQALLENNSLTVERAIKIGLVQQVIRGRKASRQPLPSKISRSL